MCSDLLACGTGSNYNRNAAIFRRSTSFHGASKSLKSRTAENAVKAVRSNYQLHIVRQNFPTCLHFLGGRWFDLTSGLSCRPPESELYSSGKLNPLKILVTTARWAVGFNPLLGPVERRLHPSRYTLIHLSSAVEFLLQWRLGGSAAWNSLRIDSSKTDQATFNRGWWRR